MFNDKSTHKERQEALQTVMRRGDVDLGEQVHSPAALNKLLARTPEEYKLFQQVWHYVVLHHTLAKLMSSSPVDPLLSTQPCQQQN